VFATPFYSNSPTSNSYCVLPLSWWQGEYYASSTFGQIISRNGAEYDFLTPYAPNNIPNNIGLKNEVHCGIVSRIKCDKITYIYKASGFTYSDVSACLGENLTGNWYAKIHSLYITDNVHQNLALFTPDEVLPFQDTEIAPTIIQYSPTTTATSTFSSTSAPYFFSGNYTYSSALTNFTKLCLQYTTTSIFSENNQCCLTLLSNSGNYNLACTPRFGGTYYYRYVFFGTQLGHLIEYPIAPYSFGFVLTGDPSGFAVSQNSGWASSTALENCEIISDLVQKTLCNLRNSLISAFTPSQNTFLEVENFQKDIISRFPFNYISEIQSFFIKISNAGSTPTAPTWEIHGTPYLTTSTIIITPYSMLPTSTMSSFNNFNLLETLRFFIKIALWFGFITLCYLSFTNLVLNSPQ
jgi:hypothetical protein